MVCIKRFIVGPLSVNCYIVHDGRECVVIDPGGNADKILDYIDNEKLEPIAIIATHGHFDHVLAVDDVREHYDIDFYLHRLDLKVLEHSARVYRIWFGVRDWSPPQPSKLVDNEPELVFNDTLRFKVLHTPGHTPGSICLLLGEHLFTGDTLFHESIGRTDLEGGDEEAMKNSLCKLLKLPDNTIIHPGHGPESTIGVERRENIYIDIWGLR